MAINRQEESDIQQRIVLILRHQYPNVVFTTSPAGVKMNVGQAVKMKKMGYRPGTPDLMIFQPIGRWHGLFIEIKTEFGIAQAEQVKFREDAELKGYCSFITKGYKATIEKIEDYLNGRIL